MPVPEPGSAAARGAPWSRNTRGPTTKAGAGGAGEVREARQRALGLVARGWERQRAGKGGRRLPGQATSKHPQPSCTAQPAHTPSSHCAQSAGPKEGALKFHSFFRCSCLEPRLEEARGCERAPTSFGLSDWPLGS